jgi:threonine dehydrogenase-like Zn-dependent dehydrogenase
MRSRRAILVESGRLEIHEGEVNPAPDELLVKISVCGLCNWELNHYKGLFGTCPQALGHEWAGIVIETGENVKNFAVGDAVTGYGGSGFADYMTALEKDSYKLARNINPEHALGEPLKCIVTVLRAASPEAGDFGLVLGCGPMGLWCIQALAGKLLGGLIAVDIDQRKLALAKKYGATHVIDSRNEDAIKRIAEITNGEMADFVIEGTGIPALLNSSVNYLKNSRGRLIIMSSYEEIAREFDFREVIKRGVEIRAAHPQYSVNQHEDMRRAVQMINSGVFNMEEIISHKFKLEDIQTAFENLHKKPGNYIKGVVVP